MSLTAQFYAGDTDKLWTTYNGNTSHTGTPVNGSAIDIWQDEATPATRNVIFQVGSSIYPLAYHSPGVMRLPSIEFNGTNDMMFMTSNAGNGPYTAMSSVLANNGKTIIMAIRFTGSGTNDASIWNNSCILSDNSQGYIGIHLKTNAGVHTLNWYNWDTNADTCSVNVSLNTDYVIMCRHDGVTLNLSVLSGSGGVTRTDASVASGNTAVMTNYLRLGINRSTVRCPMILGEVYFDNTDLGSTNSILSDIVGRWLPPADVIGSRIITSVQQKRGTRCLMRGMGR